VAEYVSDRKQFTHIFTKNGGPFLIKLNHQITLNKSSNIYTRVKYLCSENFVFIIACWKLKNTDSLQSFPLLALRPFLSLFAKWRKVTISFFMSVCPSAHMELLGSQWRYFHGIRYWVFFRNLSRRFKFYWNLVIITGTSHEDQYTFFIISGQILFRMRNVSDKIIEKNQNTHFIISNFLKSCRLWRLWKNTV
jgi:hypothetical protein